MDITRKLNQQAVYWPSPVPDGRGGYSYGTYQSILVRWEDKQELYKDAEGNERMSTSIVYRDITFSLNGYLHLGTVADFDSSADLTNPELLDDCFSINKIDSVTNIKATQTLVKAWL